MPLRQVCLMPKTFSGLLSSDWPTVLQPCPMFSKRAAPPHRANTTCKPCSETRKLHEEIWQPPWVSPQLPQSTFRLWISYQHPIRWRIPSKRRLPELSDNIPTFWSKSPKLDPRTPELRKHT